ncbi:MAG: hypothetical protein RIB59_11770, partial [Rhodospirillales bacterium]
MALTKRFFQSLATRCLVGCLAAFPVFVLSVPVSAASGCPGATTPAELTVKPVYGKITYRMGNTRSDLRRIQERHANASRGLPGDWYPLGLTQAHFEMRLNT